MFRNSVFFDKDGGTGGGAGSAPAQAAASDGNGEGEAEVLTYDGWIASQPENVKALLESHVSGLKSALKSERDARGGLEKQVRELAAKSEKGSEAAQELTALADKMAEADRKVEFYDQAHAAGVTNLRLAWLTAQADDLFDKRGQVNFETLKQSYPELFAGKATQKPPQGNAGAGHNSNQTPAGSIDAFIRRSAGRG